MSAENFYFRTDYEYGKVIASDGEWLTVELPNQETCHACGAKMLCQPNAQGRRILRVLNTLQAQLGDQVVIEQIGKQQLRLTTVQYGLPLAVFLLLVIGGNYLIPGRVFGMPQELVLMLLGSLGIGLSGVAIYFWSKRQARRQFSVFRLIEVIKS